MKLVVITGSCGLIGSESSRHFASLGYEILGIDNDMRKVFFGDQASTAWNRTRLQEELGELYHHESTDLRDREAICYLFEKFGKNIHTIIHTAAQPSHDWAAKDPFVDFEVNALGTLNLLQAMREHCPEASFIFTSTNKVYGDRPNQLPLIEKDTRWEINPEHAYANGIPEEMSIDNCLHSLFGVSKASADLMVQEYGRYFGLKTVCFRGGCLTGPGHSGTQLHGFLAYLMKCAVTGDPYTIFGHKGKQVRDNIHSYDLVKAFEEYVNAPTSGKVYNIGGSRFSNCSMKEAITMAEEISGKPMQITYSEANRIGDHIWYISDISKFQHDYPDWKLTYTVEDILQEIADRNKDRWQND